MNKKTTKKKAKSIMPFKSRSQERRERVMQEDSIRPSEDVKYSLTFLGSRKFRGKFYEKGTKIEVPEWVAKAYDTSTILQFEKL